MGIFFIIFRYFANVSPTKSRLSCIIIFILYGVLGVIIFIIFRYFANESSTKGCSRNFFTLPLLALHNAWLLILILEFFILGDIFIWYFLSCIIIFILYGVLGGIVFINLHYFANVTPTKGCSRKFFTLPLHNVWLLILILEFFIFIQISRNTPTHFLR